MSAPTPSIIGVRTGQRYGFFLNTKERQAKIKLPGPGNLQFGELIYIPIKIYPLVEYLGDRLL